MRETLAVLATAWALTAQRAAAQQGAVTDPVRSASFAPSLHIDLDSARRLESGIYIMDLTTGTGSVVSAEHPVRNRRYEGRWP